MMRPPHGRGTPGPDQGPRLSATHLFCPRCRQAMPVREKLALFLPSGVLYHYVCARCDEVLGKKEDTAPPRLA